jgi:hypothetical protein
MQLQSRRWVFFGCVSPACQMLVKCLPSITDVVRQLVKTGVQLHAAFGDFF